MPNIQPLSIKVKSGKTYEIRSFTIEEAQKLQNFLRQTAHESHHTLNCKERNIPIENIQEKIKKALEVPHDLFLGTFNNESIIGQLTFRVSHPDHPWIKHVGEFGVTVLEQYWGYGIGTALLEEMENFAKTIGIIKLEAKVRLTNERALALYKKRLLSIAFLRMNITLPSS
jgi:ribosomal protein S18 acetylase RimI-like enzyme